MFKKFFGRKRSFRKVLTPVAAIVMLAQPAGNVIKAIPEGIDIQQNDVAIPLNDGCVVTLSKYCEKTDGQNLNTTEQKLIHVKNKLEKNENFKFGIQVQNFQDIGKKIILTDPEVEEDAFVFATTQEGSAVVICIEGDEIQALKNHITDEAKQTLIDAELLANDEGQGEQNLDHNVGNELNNLVNVANGFNNLMNVANVHNPVPNVVNEFNNLMNNVNNEKLPMNVNNEELPLLDVKGHNKKNNKKQKNQCNGVGIFTFMLGLATGVGGKMAYDGVVSQNNAGGDSKYSEDEIETGYESDETDADSDGDEE